MIPGRLRGKLFVLQSVSLAWMLVECAVSLTVAWRPTSLALWAVGADSFVELLSAALVLLSVTSRLRERAINRASGALLLLLAAAVVLGSAIALVGRIQPEPSRLGIAVTALALLIMPVLAWHKRKLALATSHNALAADSVQSATCA